MEEYTIWRVVNTQITRKTPIFHVVFTTSAALTFSSILLTVGAHAIIALLVARRPDAKTRYRREVSRCCCGRQLNEYGWICCRARRMCHCAKERKKRDSRAIQPAGERKRWAPVINKSHITELSGSDSSGNPRQPHAKIDWNEPAHTNIALSWGGKSIFN